MLQQGCEFYTFFGRDASSLRTLSAKLAGQSQNPQFLSDGCHAQVDFSQACVQARTRRVDQFQEGSATKPIGVLGHLFERGDALADILPESFKGGSALR